MIHKKYLLILAFNILFSNICYSQFFINSYFGSTQQELIDDLFRIGDENEMVDNVKLFDSQEDKIIFTWQIAINNPNTGHSVKATCYFKNEIFYKVKEEIVFNNKKYRDTNGKRSRTASSTLFKVVFNFWEKEWYELDEEKSIACCEEGFYSQTLIGPDIKIQLMNFFSESEFKFINKNHQSISFLKNKYSELPIGKNRLVQISEVN